MKTYYNNSIEKLYTEYNMLLELNDIYIGKDQLNIINNIKSEHLELYHDVLEIIKKFYKLLSSVKKNHEITYQEFEQKLWIRLNEIHEVTKTLDKNLLKHLQLIFRGSLYHLLSESIILSRALTKPFGYPGDFVMLQMLYENKQVSQSNLGKYLDQFFLDDILSRAVVDRVEVMGDRVIKFINESSKNEINILNIASGSGFELRKIVQYNFNKKIIYHCFDQDLSSLLYISKNFINKNINVEIRLYKEDIRNFFRKWNKNQKFDLIYNIGLADYLPEKILSSLIKESINHVENNGVFVLAHKDYTSFPYHHPSWLYDWNFVHRNLKDYIDIIKRNTDKDFLIWFESSIKKVIYFSEFKISDDI